MDIAAASRDQAFYDLAFDCDYIAHECFNRFVNCGGRLVIETLRNAVGTDQRDFGRLLRPLADKAIFLQRNIL